MGPREAIIRKPWLLPFIAAVMRGLKAPRDVAEELGCPRRLAVSGLYALRRLGMEDVDAGSAEVCVVRWGRWFAARIGGVVVVAKVGRRRVKAYTVPLGASPGEGGKLGYRARVARMIMEKGEVYAGCGRPTLS